MTPRDCFGIIVRTVGLVLLVVSFYYLVPLSLIMFSFANFAYGTAVGPFVGGLLNVFASLYLLRGAPHLLDYCYPKSSSKLDVQTPDAETKAGW